MGGIGGTRTRMTSLRLLFITILFALLSKSVLNVVFAGAKGKGEVAGNVKTTPKHSNREVASSIMTLDPPRSENPVPIAASCISFLDNSICQSDKAVQVDTKPRDEPKKLLQQLHLELALEEECKHASSIRLDHPHAREIVNGCTLGIIFPRSLIRSCMNGVWSNNKTISYFYSGHFQQKRAWVNQYAGVPDAHVVNSTNGRSVLKETGHYDYPYYAHLQQSAYALTPAGDFHWTYRFLEAIMCGSIPVVEDNTTAQEMGYYVCMVGERPCKYRGDLRQKAAEHNFRVFLPRHSLVLGDVV